MTLPRRLGAVGATGTLVSIMIGSGIFRVASVVARDVPSPTGFMLVWITGGLLAVAGALSFGELAAMFPVTGGRYVYLREGVSPVVAFTYAWAHTFFLRPVAVGAGALVFASYLGSMVPRLAAHERASAAAIVLLLGAVNYRSVWFSAAIGTVTGAAKALALAGFAIVILVATPAASPTAAPPASGISAHAFGLALVTVMWTYSGWGSTTYITGEVRRGERVMPLVLMGGVSGCVLLFVLVNLAYLHALPMAAIATSKAVAADAAGWAFGPAGRGLIAALVVVATLGSLNGTVLASPRMSFALGQDTPQLGWLANIHRRYQTPHVAITVTCLLGVVGVLSHTFEQLADAYILGAWPFYILCVIGLFRLRRRRPDLARPFHTPGYPIVPAVFLLAAAAMLVNAAVAQPRDAIVGSGLILLGVPVFYFLTIHRSTAAAEPPVD